MRRNALNQLSCWGALSDGLLVNFVHRCIAYNLMNIIVSLPRTKINKMNKYPNSMTIVATQHSSNADILLARTQEIEQLKSISA